MPLPFLFNNSMISFGQKINEEEVANNNNILQEFFTNNFASVTEVSKKLFDFSVNVFQSSVKNTLYNNVMMSPFSLLCALGMVLSGSDGKTRYDIEMVLRISEEELNRFMQKFIQSLQKNSGELKIANALYLNDCEGVEYYTEYINKNETYYDASVFCDSFNCMAVNKINSWVQEKTDGMIERILDSIQPDDRICFLSALAFDTKWMYQYEECVKGVFIAQDGTQQNVKMMFSKENIYLEDKEAIGFMKLYSNPRFSFVALLPNVSVCIDDYISCLTGEKIVSILSKARREQVDTEMPAFIGESSIDMKEILVNMGMSEAFGENADFSKMAKCIREKDGEETKLSIDKVMQKTYISVDERGTKAAAVTLGTMVCISGGVMMPRRVILNRPFVYMIIDHKMNLPIFMGTLKRVYK